MFSASSSNGSSPPNGNPASSTPRHSDDLAVGYFNDGYLNLQRRLEAWNSAAARTFDYYRETAPPPLEAADRIAELLGAMRAGFEQARRDRVRMRRIHSERLLHAIAAAVEELKNVHVPDAGEIASRRERSPYYEWSIVFLEAMMDLENGQSSCLESVGAELDQEVAELCQPIADALMVTGRMTEILRVPTLKAAADAVPANYRKLRLNLQQFNSSAINLRDQLFANVREPLGHLRANAMLGTLSARPIPPKVVRAIANSRVIKAARPTPADEPSFGQRRGQQSWYHIRSWIWRISDAIGTLIAKAVVPSDEPEAAMSNYLESLRNSTADEMARRLRKKLPRIHDLLSARFEELERQLFEGGRRDLVRFYTLRAGVLWGTDPAGIDPAADGSREWEAAIERVNQAARRLTDV